MKIEVGAKALVDALKAAVSASSGFSQGLVHLSARDAGLAVRGTDGEIFVRRVVKLQTLDAEGEVTLAGQSLLGLVRESGAETVALKASKGKLQIVCGSGKHGLLCVDTITPEAPTTESSAGDGAYCEMQASALARLLKRSAFCASSREIRYAMNGVCLSVDKGVLTSASTDGHRLSVAKAPCKGGFKGELLVPFRAVGAILSMLADADGSAILRTNGNFVSVHAGDASVTARLNEGRFPAYKDVIPKDTPIRATVNVAGLLQAMKAVPFLSTDEARAVKLCFTTKGITAEFGSSTRGEGRIELQGTSTGDLAVSLNPIFVADVLRVLEEEDAQIGMVNANNPITFTEGDDFLSLIMPIAPREG